MRVSITTALTVGAFICAAASTGKAVPFYEQQRPFSIIERQPQELQGRFLHLTDLHMDTHYEFESTIKSECHRQPKKHRKKKMRNGKLAGYWGAPRTECDSAPRMIQHTIDWLSREWKDKIDFVIWTGDNARHDIDDKIPRTKKEILALNQQLTDWIRDAFRDDNRTIPIIPCIGNNDVHPHNKLQPGIESGNMLQAYSEMWRDFIPESQRNVFRRGGYYAVDVSPGIRVLALNTLYFFDSNPAVNGCDDEDGPGAQHLAWIQGQLALARRDSARVYMTGHVPPSAKTYYPSCLSRYIDLSVEYRDVIAAHMYGHANMDHFLLLRNADSEMVHAEKNADQYLDKLHKDYSRNAQDDGNTVVVHIAPPVLPLYNPTFRINEYETDVASPAFGTWKKYTQWYTDLAYWNQFAWKEQEPTDGDSPPKPIFEIEYATDTTYGMTDLTASSWLDFARRMTDKRSKKANALWDLYTNNMFVQSRQDE